MGQLVEEERRGRTTRASLPSRGSGGYGLIEILVSLFILSVVFVGITVGLFTAVRMSSKANDTQRADAALNSFGEILKQLEYVGCAKPSDYQVRFEAWESALGDAQPIQQPDADLSVGITSVISGCENNGDDRGWHEINIVAESRGVVREAQVAKRRDEPPPVTVAVLGVELLGLGQESVAYALNAIGSRSPHGIAAYEFTCDSQGAHPQPFIVYEEDSSDALCVLERPAEGQTAREYVIRLVVTDTRGGMATASHSVTVQPQEPPSPIGEVALPVTTTTTTTTTLPGVTTTTEAETYPPMVLDIRKGSSGCCNPFDGWHTWSQFSWEAQPGISLYRVTLKWAVNPGMGTFVKDFRPGGHPGGYTQSSGRVTVKFQEFGLSLAERYTVSVQTGVPLPGGGTQWSGLRYLCNGAPVRLSAGGC